MKILLTAFDPFGGEKINPALEAVKLVHAPEGTELYKLEVPTVFGEAPEKVKAKIREIQPDAVLCIGQAGGRDAITPERVAINYEDARIADNAGFAPKDRPVDPQGPAAYFATLPVKAMAQAIRDAGIAARVSNTAGTFVCNNLMYSVLRFAALEYPGMKAGFMHVPYIPQQTIGKENVPSMPLNDIARGIEAALGAIAQG